MKFKAKIDWWVHLLFAGLVICTIWFIWGAIFWGVVGIIMLVVFAPLTVFYIVPMWVNTYYLLDDDELLIKCGLGKGTRIAYSQITSVYKTRDPISSPALSFDRLEVRYKVKSGKFSDTIIIAPKDKQGFIEQLQKRNECIESSDVPIPMCKSMKTLLTALAVIIALTLVGVGALFIAGEREPVVTVRSDSIRISAMYGTSVDLSSVTGISMLDQSMREIGAGTRTNGYGGTAWRGHFTAGLLFVRPDSSPTIRIERYRRSDVYISFRDSERTMMLYNELSALSIGDVK